MRTRKRTDPNRRTVLYRFFDADDRLLYVGITVNTKKRWQYHAREQQTTWWPLVARNTVEWLSTRREAEKAEREAIANESPLYNVMHTDRNHRTYGNRRGSVAVAGVSPTRGKQMLATIQEHFPEAPFTQLDVLALVPISRSAVGQNFRVLLARSDIVTVGRRTRTGYPGLGETLYVVPESPLAKSTEPIYQVVQADASPLTTTAKVARRPIGSTPAPRRGWVYGSFPSSPAFRTLAAAREAFMDREFSRADLAKLTGMSMPGLLKHAVSLEHHGFIECTGREPLAGRSGHPPKLYVVTQKEPPADQSDRPARSPSAQRFASQTWTEPGAEDLVTFEEIALLLERGRWGRPMLRDRVVELAKNDPEWPVPEEAWIMKGEEPAFPWGLVGEYFKARVQRMTVFTGVLGSEPRGYRLYQVAEENFGQRSFTRAQLANAAGLTPPGVQMNVRCLVAAGFLEQVGTRKPDGPGGLSLLYRVAPQPSR